MNKPRILLHERSLSRETIDDFVRNLLAILQRRQEPVGRQNQQVLACRLLECRLMLKIYRDARRGIERFRPLRFTRAWRSYRAAEGLRSAGIDTPSPRFLVQQDGHLILACDRVHGQQLYELIRTEGWMETHRQRLVQELSGLLDKLEEAMVTHGDLHPRNILMDASGKLWLIDLDGVRFHTTAAGFAKKRTREENRLARQLEIEPELLRGLRFKLKQSR